MILALTNLIIHLFGIDFARARRFALIGIGVALILVILFCGWLINSCRNSSFEKKVDKLNSNISTINGEIKVLTNEKTNVSESVDKTAGNVNAAQNRAENVKGKNINSFDNSFINAKARYCAEFPRDCK